MSLGTGRSVEEQKGLIGFLREKLDAGAQFTFNALYWEPQGGRRYPFIITDYDGPLTMSRRAYGATAGPGRRNLLAAIKRDVRHALVAPEGWQLVEVDYKSCHAALAAAVSGDQVLAQDVVAGVHEVTGQRFAPQLSAAAQRALGKEMNNKVTVLSGASG